MSIRTLVLATGTTILAAQAAAQVRSQASGITSDSPDSRSLPSAIDPAR